MWFWLRNIIPNDLIVPSNESWDPGASFDGTININGELYIMIK